LVLYPEAEKAQEPADMILHAHVRIVKVTDTVVLIKANQQFSVSNRDVSWHDYMASLCFQGWLPGTY